MISIKITADNHADLQRQLQALLGLSAKESAVSSYKGVDIANSMVEDAIASAVDPVTPGQRPRRPKANGSIPRTPQSVESPEPEGPAVEAPDDVSSQPKGAGADTAAIVGVEQATSDGVTAVEPEAEAEDEVKAIVNRITGLCINDKEARTRVTAWRDERGLKWIRELGVEHLDDARDLLKELTP